MICQVVLVRLQRRGDLADDVLPRRYLEGGNVDNFEEKKLSQFFCSPISTSPWIS